MGLDELKAELSDLKKEKSYLKQEADMKNELSRTRKEIKNMKYAKEHPHLYKIKDFTMDSLKKAPGGFRKFLKSRPGIKKKSGFIKQNKKWI